jgi:Flp pilus assembly protein TadG
MTMRRMLRNSAGAGAAEFALVLPLLIFLLFGIIDVGRWLWAYNQAAKATQMGVRMAVVTDYLSTSVGASYVNVTCGGSTLTQGDNIPAACLTNVTCTNTGCSPGGSVADYSAKFDPIVAKMQNFMRPTSQLQATNVTIEYTQSGLGYAGNPEGADLAPLVTVRLSNLQFRPLIALALVTMNMPDFHSSLTFEDGTGVQSN